jgi:thiosulfate/3-mercaptopyruvate sulfurtransferase
MKTLRVVVAAAALLALAQTGPPSLLVSASELASLSSDSSVVILHAGDRAAVFAEGHIPGARFVRYGDFAVDGAAALGSELPPVEQLERVFEAAGVSDSSRVVIYGTSTVVAARAFFTLDLLGHRRLSLLDGGLKAWRAENRPIETGAGPAEVRRGELTPRMQAQQVVDARFVQTHTQATAPPAIALIDVRPDREFLGTDRGMNGVHSAGHIPGARQLPWDALVAPDGRFLPRDQLRAKLEAAGAVPQKPVVSYCMVGMRAAVVYFVARHLGYDARLYDGSLVDWTQKQLPVETGHRKQGST